MALIKICCYDHIEMWRSRKRALAFYQDCMFGTEGCESERYCNIVAGLMSGAYIVNDGYSNFGKCVREMRYINLMNGSCIRDEGGEIAFPCR